MKSTLNLIVLGLFAVMLAACQTTPTEDTSAGTDEAADARDVAQVVVGDGGSGADMETSDLAPGEVRIGGLSGSSASGSLGGAGGSAGTVVSAQDTVLYFDFDLSSLTPQSRAALTRIAAALRTTDSNIRVEGHADERGTREYNIALGERRAKAVSDFLVLQGVSASRIETISYGEERPANSGTGERSWSLNRRVEIK